MDGRHCFRSRRGRWHGIADRIKSEHRDARHRQQANVRQQRQANGDHPEMSVIGLSLNGTRLHVRQRNLAGKNRRRNPGNQPSTPPGETTLYPNATAALASAASHSGSSSFSWSSRKMFHAHTNGVSGHEKSGIQSLMRPHQ
jgi:hypothetical protein